MAGESTDFTTFYESTRADVFRVVLMTRCGAVHDAEDAVSEAYTRAYLGWERLQSHENPTAWVIRTALNQRVSWWRRRRREAPPQATDGGVRQAPQESLDPRMVELLRSLPQGQRQVLALRILLDQSTQQTARTLRISEGTVKTQLHRALSTLRDEFSDQHVKEAWS